MTKRELIELRARQIFMIAQEMLLIECTDFTVGTAFRYSFLVTRRSPRAYYHAFKDGDMRISPDEVAEFIWAHSEKIENPHHLLPEERETITRHNQEVAELNKHRDVANIIALDQQRLIRNI